MAAGSGAVAGAGCALFAGERPRTPPLLPADAEDQVEVTNTGDCG
jgi:hypothetical protein